MNKYTVIITEENKAIVQYSGKGFAKLPNAEGRWLDTINPADRIYGGTVQAYSERDAIELALSQRQYMQYRAERATGTESFV